MPAFSSSRSLIKDLSRHHGFAAKLGEYQLRRQWESIAGEFVAAHTRPTRIRFRTLHVAVDNAVWLHQLTYLKATLLENIQSAMREIEIRDIIFRIGALPPPPKPTDAPAPAKKPPAHQTSPATQEAAACAHIIHDKDLRDTLTRVMAKALSVAHHVKGD